jgi:hypothetical protein
MAARVLASMRKQHEQTAPSRCAVCCMLGAECRVLGAECRVLYTAAILRSSTERARSGSIRKDGPATRKVARVPDLVPCSRYSGFLTSFVPPQTKAKGSSADQIASIAKSASKIKVRQPSTYAPGSASRALPWWVRSRWAPAATVIGSCTKWGVPRRIGGGDGERGSTVVSASGSRGI